MLLTFGGKIKAIRKTNNLNQMEFASIIGISQGSLSELEQDKYNPSVETIIALKKHFNVNLDWLLLDDKLVDNEDGKFAAKINENEIKLLSLFRNLRSFDQDEVIDIVTLKVNRYKA